MKHRQILISSRNKPNNKSPRINSFVKKAINTKRVPIINNIKGDTWEIINRYRCGINIGNEIVYSEKMRKQSRRVFEKNLSEEIFINKVNGIIEGVV